MLIDDVKAAILVQMTRRGAPLKKHSVIVFSPKGYNTVYPQAYRDGIIGGEGEVKRYAGIPFMIDPKQKELFRLVRR